MLTQYVQGAMKKAAYEALQDGTFYGEIPGFRGVLANAPTLEECREELQEVLEGWIILGLRLGHELPVVDTIDLGAEVGGNGSLSSESKKSNQTSRLIEQAGW